MQCSHSDSIQVNASDNNLINHATNNGWIPSCTGASIGDNPAFILFRNRQIQETHYDDPIHRQEI